MGLALLLILACGAAVFQQLNRDPRRSTTRVYIDGIPHVDYGGSTGIQENPVTIAGWGMSEGGDLIRAADWLVEHQGLDGAWRYAFDYVVTRRAELQQGWSSAIAQGFALSALSRAFEVEPKAEYLRAMRAVVRFLRVDVADGGVATTLDGMTWWEEYPTEPASYVLNGYLYLLVGLWEAKDHVPEALPLYWEGRSTLVKNLGRWDVDGVVAYDLLHEEVGGKPWIDRYYDSIHERLLRQLLDHEDSHELRRWLNHWYPS